MKNIGINQVVLWASGVCSLSETPFYNARTIWGKKQIDKLLTIMCN